VNREEIEQLIPHRPPFLWLDEIVAVDDRTLHARKWLDPELDVFRGHYPSFPVLPGVLQCEAVFQAGAVLISRTEQVSGDVVPVVTRLNNVQFRRLVRPGETLDISVELTDRLSTAFYLKGNVRVDGKTATRLEFACTLTEAPE